MSYQNLPIIDIATVSTSQYFENRERAIYPAFVNDEEYESWTMEGKKDYFQLETIGGEAPFVWEITGGALPDGIKLSQDGKLFGLAKKEGDFAFTVKVTDKTGKFYQKELTMTAYPYRGSWFNDAKFGIMVQWGAYAIPALTKYEDIYKLDERTVNFNADEWVKQIYDMGGRVLNFTVIAGDGIRMWPSTTPSENNLVTKKAYVPELVKACKKYGVKFIAYIAGHIAWTPMRDFDPVDKTCATLNLGIINELLDMGVDGFWVDTGGLVGVVEDFDWDRAMPLIRTKNPFVTMELNSAVGSQGRIERYHDCDVVSYEGFATTDETKIEVAYPNLTRKRMAIDMNNMLNSEWCWRYTDEDDQIGKEEELGGARPTEFKPAKLMIDNIRQNWERGACSTMSIAVPTSGKLISKSNAPILKEISEWVLANRDKYTLKPHDTGLIKYDKYIEWEGFSVSFPMADASVTALCFSQEDNGKVGNYKIVRRSDRYPVAYGSFEIKDNKITFPSVEFKRNERYLIFIQSESEFRKFSSSNDGYICHSKAVMDETWVEYGFDTSSIGNELCTLDYEIVSRYDDTNLLYHARRLDLTSNEGEIAFPSGGNMFGENVLNDDPEKSAVAGDEKWAWTFHIELDKEHTLNELYIRFGNGYPTDWNVRISTDNVDYTTVFQQQNGELKEITVPMKQQKARFIKITSLRPDGPGQQGGQMQLNKVILN